LGCAAVWVVEEHARMGRLDAAEPPQFVEIEDDRGRSIRYGEWVQRDDGAWVLRVPA
jgi:hypothetical protein